MGWNIVIISGGQTGADRAALDFALALDVPHGGWCPSGRQAGDGVLDEKYKLKETPSDDPAERTEWNVRDSDATVVMTLGPKAKGGAALTLRFAKKMKKPFIHLHSGVLAAAEKLIAFTEKHAVKRLNVAGSRESEEPGLYAWVDGVLRKTHKEMQSRNAGY
jgi:hypothetical protein